MSLEKDNKRERRRYYFEQAILGTLEVGAVMSTAFIMPNALQYLDKIGWIKGKKNPKYGFETTITHLKRKGLIEVADEESKTYKITKKGKMVLWKYESKYLKIEQPKRWDRRWRLIIFDIREKDRFQRDAVRLMLQNIGCVMLQNSVWVYPYDCEKVITLLKANYEIGKEVLYIIAEKIEEDSWIKKHFSLK